MGQNKQLIKDFTAKQVEVLQVIHGEVASTWALDDPEVMMATVAIYREWSEAYGPTTL